jgi:hypothetical protein
MPLEEAGTLLDPYLIENPSDFDEIGTYDSAIEVKYFKVVNSFSYNGTPDRITFYGDLDLNGKEIDEITGFEFSYWINEHEGRIHGGKLTANVTTNNGGNEAFVKSVNDAGVLENMEFGGLITCSGDGDASIIKVLSGDGVRNCIFSADLQTVDGTSAPILRSNLDELVNCISTGTYSASGVGEVSGLSNADNLNMSNCFYDATKNPTVAAGERGVGKTTAELQDINTYTDFKTIGLGRDLAGTVSATNGSQILIGSGTSFNNHTVGETITVRKGPSAIVKTINTITNDTELTVTSEFNETFSGEIYYDFPNGVYDMADIASYTDEEWVIDDGNAYPILAWSYTPPTLQSGIITLSGNPIADSVVAIMRATNPFDATTHEVVEFVTADGNGVYKALTGRNPLYDYWASPVGFQSEFTGTISSVTNEFITLPSDLSGISMGGINDQSYYIKGISGPGAGTAFKVISRSGNTIELAVAPAFDNTTTFDLGKAYFPSQPFSKTALT